MSQHKMNRQVSRSAVASLRNFEATRSSKLVYWAMAAAFGCLLANNWMNLT